MFRFIVEEIFFVVHTFRKWAFFKELFDLILIL